MTDASKSGRFATDYPQQAPQYPKAREAHLRDVEAAARGAMACDESLYPEPQEFAMTPVTRIDIHDAANDGHVEEPSLATAKTASRR